MREQLIDALDHRDDLAAVDADFVHLFSSWFNRGFLVLRRIDWSTPAMILEKIIRYEAVHRIRSWDDLRRRIDPPDRRCYAFFHPALVDEPLIFVEVALTREIPDAIAPILSVQRDGVEPDKATTAVFYSISNCQRGLAGVSFGNFLIKQVVQEISPRESAAQDLRHAVAGAGLRRAGSTASASPKTPARCRRRTARRSTASTARAGGSCRRCASRCRSRCCAPPPGTILRAKNRRGLPAGFGGALPSRQRRAARAHQLARRRQRERHRQSYGLMVNYLYDLDDIEKNHEAYAEGRTVVASNAVPRLLRERAGRPVPVPVAGIIRASLRAICGLMLCARRSMRPPMTDSGRSRSFPTPRSTGCCAMRAATTTSRRSRSPTRSCARSTIWRNGGRPPPTRSRSASCSCAAPRRRSGSSRRCRRRTRRRS